MLDIDKQNILKYVKQTEEGKEYEIIASCKDEEIAAIIFNVLQNEIKRQPLLFASSNQQQQTESN